MMNENNENTNIPMTPEQFALLGGGMVAYVKPLMSEEAQRLFPQVEGVRPGLHLFALVNADGTPIMLTDSRDAAIANAWENQLQTVSLH
jgi:hypothetical protein